jgi:hypothetical protein
MVMLLYWNRRLQSSDYFKKIKRLPVITRQPFSFYENNYILDGVDLKHLDLFLHFHFFFLRQRNHQDAIGVFGFDRVFIDRFGE